MAAKIRKSAAAHGVRVGDVIKGKYKILSLIGKGGMSRVFLAMDMELTNKQWAIKEVDRSAVDPTGRPIEQSLANEANLLARLDHPNIVRIVDTVKTDDFIYVVMDHVEGEALDKVVRREGPQREEDVQRWMLQVCDALGYLHRQHPPIIYRDMKPANIMLHPDGYIKLIDFGVSREYKDEARKDTIAFGTTGYAAPEQYGKAQTDARADIYAMGATMWHLLAGEAPPMEFPLPDVRTKNANVSEGFAEVIIPKCCRLERDKRYQTCDELAADLEVYDELTREYREGQVKKVRTFAGTAIAAVLCLILGFVCLGVREGSITQKYDSYLSIADKERESNPADAEQNYLLAIEKRPGEIAPYEGLIESYKVEEGGTSAFDEKEQKQFNEVYQTNLEELKKNSRYPDLEYEIGKLYWYFYVSSQTDPEADPDGAQTNRIAASVEHFKIAAEGNGSYTEQAKVYAGIAQFTADIRKKMQSDDDDDQMYADYWKNLEALAKQVGDDNGDNKEAVRLDAYALITDAMETYMNKFESAGVKKADAEGLYTTVDRGLTNLQASDENVQRRQDTLTRLETKVKPKITVVYSGAAVGQD